MQKLILFLFTLTSILHANTLQKAIDDASAYSTIKLSRGTFLGKLIIDKPITIIGVEDDVIIKGNNIGTVINGR